MKVEIKIPRGWRRLRVGTRVVSGDVSPILDEWLPCESRFVKVNAVHIVIRRIGK